MSNVVRNSHPTAKIHRNVRLAEQLLDDLIADSGVNMLAVNWFCNSTTSPRRSELYGIAQACIYQRCRDIVLAFNDTAANNQATFRALNVYNRVETALVPAKAVVLASTKTNANGKPPPSAKKLKNRRKVRRLLNNASVHSKNR